MIKKLWLDIDETLVSSLLTKKVGEADKYIAACPYWEGFKFNISTGFGWDSAETEVVSFVRPGAREFIQWCKETYGVENVNVLTRGSAGYIFKLFKAIGFDFEKQRIFTLEDIEYPSKNFDSFNNVLVDNEDHDYHTRDKYNKVDFLSGIPANKMVLAREFVFVRAKPEGEKAYLDTLKPEIEQAFLNKNNEQTLLIPRA